MTVTVSTIKAMVPEAPQDNDSFIQGCIDDAVVLMGDAWATANPPVATNHQDIVIKYLAAHFTILNIERGGLLRSRLGDSDESYNGNRQETGISLTRYGQQAIALDPTRKLASMDQAVGGVAQFRVV